MMNNSQKYDIVFELSDQQKDQLHELYRKEWWTKDRSRKDINHILDGSSFVIGVVADRLIGFARVLTDYYKYAYVYDVIVDEKWRGHGLGKLILENIIQHPRLYDVKYLELTCADEHIQFYEKHGFSRDFGATYPMRRPNPESNVS